jgi:hypothetical protein
VFGNQSPVLGLGFGELFVEILAGDFPILMRRVHGHREPHKHEAHDQNDHDKNLTEPIHGVISWISRRRGRRMHPYDQ